MNCRKEAVHLKLSGRARQSVLWVGVRPSELQ